jgi:CheY-like chemotaxis protein/HPt (histidine-containing phosphotransfer) domain-containing protein
MGGKIWVVSAPGEGTVFHFTLCMQAAMATPQLVSATGATSASVLRARKVLVVDDNRSNRLILGEILESWHMLPTLASDSEQALQAIGQANAARAPFALILLDSRMPRIDSFELAATMCALPGTRESIIMMLVSSNVVGEAERCKALRITRFLRKPIKQSELFDAIIALVIAAPAPTPPRLAPAGAISAAPVRLLKVLVAEDHPVNQTLVGEILRSRGHFFSLANNGMEALALLNEMDYDAILMDGQMPVMDGYEATREIRRREHGSARHVHIIALTANAMKEDRDLCLAAGMDDYVAKPIDPDQLLARLERMERNAQPWAATAACPIDAGFQSFDRAKLEQRLVGKTALMRKMVCLFLDDLPKTLLDIESAAARADRVALERGAHHLKGAASTLSAHAVSDAASMLEQCARSGDDKASGPALDTLRRQCQALAGELVQLLAEPE